MRKPTKDALRKHIGRVHKRSYKREGPREKRHFCEWRADREAEMCGKGFTTAGKLADHMNTHTGGHGKGRG